MSVIFVVFCLVEIIEERRRQLEEEFEDVSVARRMRFGLSAPLDQQQQQQHVPLPPTSANTVAATADDNSPERRVSLKTSVTHHNEEEEEEGELLAQLENEPQLMDDQAATLED